MAEKPVAKLALNTRTHGTYFCQNCKTENKDALLMSDASIVCPKCKTPMPEFQPFAGVVMSAAPVSTGKKSKKSRWVINWHSPDPSQEGTTAYDDMQEALEAATSWIKYEGEQVLENDRLRKQANAADDPWEEQDQERMDLLEKTMSDIAAGRLAEAVVQWLYYQDDVDPQDFIEIGPSGYISSSPMEFRTAVDAEK